MVISDSGAFFEVYLIDQPHDLADFHAYLKAYYTCIRKFNVIYLIPPSPLFFENLKILGIVVHGREQNWSLSKKFLLGTQGTLASVLPICVQV